MDLIQKLLMSLQTGSRNKCVNQPIRLKATPEGLSHIHFAIYGIPQCAGTILDINFALEKVIVLSFIHLIQLQLILLI